LSNSSSASLESEAERGHACVTQEGGWKVAGWPQRKVTSWAEKQLREERCTVSDSKEMGDGNHCHMLRKHPGI